MKSSLLFLLIFLSSSFLFAQDFSIPETAPEFKKGELSAFLQSQLEYPREARDQKIKGSVLVAFTVTEKGEVVNPELLSNLGAGCGEEAMRLVELTSTYWTPGIQDGQYVSVRMHERVYFDPNNTKEIVREKPMTSKDKNERTRSDRIQTLFNLGMKNFSEEKYSKARHYFNQVLSLQPDDENTMYNLALTKVKLKDMDGACDDLLRLADKGNEDAKAMREKVCK